MDIYTYIADMLRQINDKEAKEHAFNEGYRMAMMELQAKMDKGYIVIQNKPQVESPMRRTPNGREG